MKINKVHLITFSPTRTSLRIGKAIANGIEAEELVVSDFTHSDKQESEIKENDLAVISLPVYGGHIAPMAKKRIDSVKGCGTPAVVIAVYGNRDYEMALHEMAEYCSGHGFKVVAAGTFVGEHSYSTQLTPIAVGRPDADDEECARQFGVAIRQKMELSENAEDLSVVDVNDIERPKQDAEAVSRFKSTVAGWVKDGMIKPSVPEVDRSKCNDCGVCVGVCPTAAISEDDVAVVSVDLCIKCCACVKECPEHARSLSTPFARLLADNFKERKENMTLL